MTEQLVLKKRGLVTVIRLGPEYGSIDIDALDELEQHLLHIAAEVDSSDLLLDCSGTEYFGSLFLEVLIRCHQRLAVRGGSLAFCGLAPPLRDELETLRLDQLWPLYDSREAALAALTMPVPRPPEHVRIGHVP